MITKFCSRSFSLLSRYVTGIRPMSTMQRSIPNDGKTLDDFVSIFLILCLLFSLNQYQ